MNIEAFRKSVIWFSAGLVLNRIKYFLLSIIVLQMGLNNLAIFYLSIRLVNEFSSSLNRFIGSTFNKFLRDEKFISVPNNLNNVINDSLITSSILGLMGGVIILLLADPIAYLLKNASIAPALSLLSASVPFIVVTNQIVQTLMLRAKFRDVVVFQHILEAIFMISFAYVAIVIIKTNVFIVLLLQVIAFVISLPAALFFLRSTASNWHFKVEPPKLPLNLSKAAIFTPFSVGLFNLADLLVIGFYLGTITLGIYIAMLVGPMLIFAIATSVFGMFIHAVSPLRQDPQRVKRISAKVLNYIFILATPLTLLFLLYPEKTVSTIGIHAPIDPQVVRLLSLAFFIKIVAWMAERVLMVARIANLNMLINVFISFSVFALLILTIPQYGLVGASLILAGAALMEAVAKTVLVYKNTQIYFISQKSLKTISLGIIIYVLSQFVIFLSFSLFVPLLILAFLTGIFFVKSLDKNDLAEIFQKFTSTLRPGDIEKL